MVELHENIVNNIIDISSKIANIVSSNGYELESDIVLSTPTGKRFVHNILSENHEYALLYSEKEGLLKQLTTLYKNQIINASDDDKAICANTIIQYIKPNCEFLGIISFDICSFYRVIKK